MVLDVPSDVWTKVEEKARENGVSPAQYAVAALREISTMENEADYEVSGFADEHDTPISHEEAAPLIPGVLRGLADVAAGRTRPATDVFHDLEVKYGLGSGK